MVSISSGKYYIKEFNELIENKPFFDQLVLNIQETYEKFVEMSRNNDYTTANISHYWYHQNYHKLIGTDK